MHSLTRHRLDQLAGRLDELHKTARTIAEMPLASDRKRALARARLRELTTQTWAAKQSIAAILTRIDAEQSIEADPEAVH